MSHAAPNVTGNSCGFCTVEGTFYRAIDPDHAEFALAGSRTAGRFSPVDVPTLYLSSSREGVTAAMIAHTETRPSNLETLAFEVQATEIADLRQRELMVSLGIDVDAAAAPWQDEVANGREPASWGIRNKLIELGAHGLIDPSRKRPGLWHLMLFDWNNGAGPSVRAL